MTSCLLKKKACDFLAATSSLSVGWFTKIPNSLAATVQPRRLKFDMEVKCVCEKVCVCVYDNLLKGAWQWECPIAKRCITSKWIHRFAQEGQS